jgi:hypothetical protein
MSCAARPGSSPARQPPAAGLQRRSPPCESLLPKSGRRSHYLPAASRSPLPRPTLRLTGAPPRLAAPRLDTRRPGSRLLQTALWLASGAMSCLMAGYLALCYYVTACLSVPVLDFMVLVCTMKPDSADTYFLDDMAFMDSYKAARWASAAGLEVAALGPRCSGCCTLVQSRMAAAAAGVGPQCHGPGCSHPILNQCQRARAGTCCSRCCTRCHSSACWPTCWQPCARQWALRCWAAWCTRQSPTSSTCFTRPTGAPRSACTLHLPAPSQHLIWGPGR